MAALTPRKFGLTFVPPSLTVVYTAPDGRKARRRNIPVRHLAADSDAAAIAAQLVRAHADLLGKVQPAQLEGLCKRLIEAISKRVQPGDASRAAIGAAATASAAPSPPAPRMAGATGVGGDDNLNALDDAALNEVKAKMNVGFSASQLKPGDAGYEYDKRVSFAPPKERSEWDDELEDFSSSEEEDLFGKKGDTDGLLP